MKNLKEFHHSGTTDASETNWEQDHRRLARTAAAEGMVLLKNDGVLPIGKQTAVALLGAGAGHTVKGGTGSGDVNEREAVTIVQGLKNAGIHLTSEDWIEDYDLRYQKAREDWKQLILNTVKAGDEMQVFSNYAENPFQLPEGRALLKQDIEDAKVAVYVISRIAGEGRDRRKVRGDYYLSDKELQDIRFLDNAGIPIVLVCNTGGPVELEEVLTLSGIKAVLAISQPGEEGGNALADILLGDVVPGGKLSTTWAVHYEDYPSSDTFSYLSGDVTKEYYREGIYIGYRYFDTFGIKPLFPFGFGLSYTSFEIGSFKLTHEAGESVTAEAVVKNTGRTYTGKEVVQVYVSCPQEGLAKEYQRLVGFAKTGNLAPGQTEVVRITFSAKALASFSEETGAWVVEKGCYGVRIGNSSANTTLCGILKAKEDTLIEETGHICPLKEALNELTPPEELKVRTSVWRKEAEEKQLPVLTFIPGHETLADYQQDTEIQEAKKEIQEEAEKLADTIPVEELVPLLYGSFQSESGALGSAGVLVPGSAGETTGTLKEKYGIGPVVMADGPAGLRLIKTYEVDKISDKVYDQGFLAGLEGGCFLEPERHAGADTYYQYCTAFPAGTLLAQSFDTALLTQVGRAVAEEMEIYHVSWWLAPGMNIHRNPLCGRNFEYYSEDPLVSGRMAAAMTQGVQNGRGTGTTIKHFACNNQEDNRTGSDSIISERALREIYLRGFEIAVKESQPMCIMTSYNLINGVHAANCKDICTKAAREEWGFQGMIMTDWTTTYPAGGSIPWKCVKAGNDLIMPGYAGDSESILKALKSGELEEAEVRACAARLLNIILQTGIYEDAESYQK